MQMLPKTVGAVKPGARAKQKQGPSDVRPSPFGATGRGQALSTDTRKTPAYWLQETGMEQDNPPHFLTCFFIEAHPFLGMVSIS